MGSKSVHSRDVVAFGKEGRLHSDERGSPIAASILQTLPIFSTLNAAELDDLSLQTVLLRVPRQGQVVCVGDLNYSIHLVVSGNLKETSGDQEGREVILSVLRPGEVFGEFWIEEAYPSTTTVRAMTESSIVVFPSDVFRQCMQDYSEVAIYVIHNLIRRLRVADRKIESLSLHDVYGRVERVLSDLAEERNGIRVVMKPMTRQDISQMVGASREMVSRVMSNMQQCGSIEEKQAYFLLRKWRY